MTPEKRKGQLLTNAARCYHFAKLNAFDMAIYDEWFVYALEVNGDSSLTLDRKVQEIRRAVFIMSVTKEKHNAQLR